MNNLLEKLGIKDLPWEVKHGVALKSDRIHGFGTINSGGLALPSSDEELSLLAAAPEMLEALIYFCVRVEEGSIRSRTTFAKYKEVIKKASGKTWDEIKELLNE